MHRFVVFKLLDIKNKKVIVTGGTKGIGKKVALDCLKRGAHVSVVSSNEKNLSDLHSNFPGLFVRKCDLTKEKEISEFCNHYAKEFESCDILINNAGISKSNLVENLNSKNLNDIFKVNFFAPFLLIKHLLGFMKEKRSGVILNVASTLATRAMPYNSLYCASKAALIQFTRCLAIEAGPFNVRVNCISPGYCKTNMNSDFLNDPKRRSYIENRIPLKRLLDLEKDLLPLIRLLISDCGGYITGANLIVDGGFGVW